MKKTFLLPIALALSAYLLLPLPGLSAPLPDRIEDKRAQIEEKKQQEGVLTTTIQRFNNRIAIYYYSYSNRCCRKLKFYLYCNLNS